MHLRGDVPYTTILERLLLLSIQFCSPTEVRYRGVATGVHYRGVAAGVHYGKIHDKNLQKLMLEVYRCVTSGNPSFLWELFNRKILPYTLRIKNLLQLPNTRTKKYGNESLTFRGSIIWNQLPDQYKATKTENEFEMKIKSWKGFKCSCRICI